MSAYYGPPEKNSIRNAVISNPSIVTCVVAPMNSAMFPPVIATLDLSRAVIWKNRSPLEMFFTHGVFRNADLRSIGMDFWKPVTGSGEASYIPNIDAMQFHPVPSLDKDIFRDIMAGKPGATDGLLTNNHIKSVLSLLGATEPDMIIFQEDKLVAKARWRMNECATEKSDHKKQILHRFCPKRLAERNRTNGALMGNFTRKAGLQFSDPSDCGLEAFSYYSPEYDKRLFDISSVAGFISAMNAICDEGDDVDNNKPMIARWSANIAIFYSEIAKKYQKEEVSSKFYKNTMGICHSPGWLGAARADTIWNNPSWRPVTALAMIDRTKRKMIPEDARMVDGIIEKSARIAIKINEAFKRDEEKEDMMMLAMDLAIHDGSPKRILQECSNHTKMFAMNLAREWVNACAS